MLVFLQRTRRSGLGEGEARSRRQRGFTAARVLLLAAVCGWAAGCNGSSPGKAAGSPANLLLVTLDTVRADHLGSYGYREAETPSLDRLARAGLRFERAVAAAPLTLPSHATLLTGLLPVEHGLHGNGVGALPEAIETLATRLSAAGYRTGAFVGAFVLDRRFGLARGFEVYDDAIDRSGPAGASLEAERPGREVVDRALAWLSKEDSRPFFAWVHLFDAHAPYAPAEPFASRHAGRPYDGEIAAADAEVGRLMAWLEASGGLTVVAASGDHGESLGEHGELTHGLLLYEPTLRVPLLIAAPGRLPAGLAIETPVSLADLAPTLAGLAGHPWPEPPLPPAGPAPPPRGRDLSAVLAAGQEPREVEVVAETRYPETFGWSALATLRKGRLKYIEAPRPELYDLASDPGETSNRLTAGGPPAGAAKLPAAAPLPAGAGMAARLAEIVRADAAGPVPEVDAATRQRLAALGYVAPPAARLPAGGSRRDPKDAVDLFRGFEEAHWARTAGRPGEARARLEELVADDPGNAVFRAELAAVLKETGDLDRAVPLYREAVAISPRDPDAWYNLATALAAKGLHGEALEALRAALEQDEKRPEAWNALGVAYASSGKSREAAAAFERAVALDPANPRAWNNLGNAQRDLGQPGPAAEAYQRAVALAPDYPDPLNGLGTLEVARDRPSAALPYFERALALNPKLHEVRLNRAISLELSGDRAAAITAYREFLAQAQGDPSFARERQAAQQLLARLTRGG